jgi:hypothetical protein
MKRWILRVVAILVACIAAVEVAGALFFLWQNGRLIYANRAAGPSASTVAVTSEGDFRQRLHPYFGFSGPYDRAVGSFHTNSAGFMQRDPTTLPFTPAADDVVVAVSGGSVTQRLIVAYAGGIPLGEALQAIPAFAGKRVVIISIAQGAAKQPQQLLALSYLLALGQRIDLVINIDGFNEFALAYQNDRVGLHPVLPAAQMMLPFAMQSCDAPPCRHYSDLAVRVGASKAAMEEYSDDARRARSGLSLVKAHVLAGWNRRKYAAAFREYWALLNEPRMPFLMDRFSLDMPYTTLGPRVFDLLFDLWLRSSQQMKLLSVANGALYLHVVQPNQYYSKHTFSEHEKQIALLAPESHDHHHGVAVGYALLRERHAILDANGIVSAIGLFDEEPDEVFMDSCCHYTAKGENLMGRFVAAEVQRRLDAAPLTPLRR